MDETYRKNYSSHQTSRGHESWHRYRRNSIMTERIPRPWTASWETGPLIESTQCAPGKPPGNASAQASRQVKLRFFPFPGQGALLSRHLSSMSVADNRHISLGKCPSLLCLDQSTPPKGERVGRQRKGERRGERENEKEPNTMFLEPSHADGSRM